MRKNIEKHNTKSILYAINNVKGITLTTLVITIVVILILAGVATYTGIEAIDNTKRTKFIAELKIMQSYVNQWYEDCKPNNIENWNDNIQAKFSDSGAIWLGTSNNETADKAKTTLSAAGVTLSANNFYYLSSNTLNSLGVEGVSQDVLVSVQDRKVVSYLGLKFKNAMYYTIDSIGGENGIDAIYNVDYDERILKDDEPKKLKIDVTGRSVYIGDTAKNAKYKFTVAITQISDHINKGELYYGKKENGSVKNWIRTEDTTFQVDRDGTYQFRYIDAAGNTSDVVDYVIEPKATIGAGLNTKMKSLAGNESPTVSTSNTTIKSIKIADIKPSDSIINNNDNKISSNNSQYPIYMWFDNGTIYLWSEENWICLPNDCTHIFRGLKSLTNIDTLNFYTGNVTSMYCMFYECIELTDLNLSSFDTGNVTTMSQMFYNCKKLNSLDLSNFNTSNVTKMNHMFFCCSNLTNINLSNFNTTNVISIGAMFYGCSNLTSLDLSNFNTINVTDMSTMFFSCQNLTSLDISSFNTNNSTSMDRMFAGCQSINNLDLSNFDTRNVYNMFRMFYNCSNLKTIYVSSNFVTTSLTNDNIMSGNNVIGTKSSNLFDGCTSLVGGKGTAYNSSNVNADYARIDDPTNNKPGYFTRKPTE